MGRSCSPHFRAWPFSAPSGNSTLNITLRLFKTHNMFAPFDLFRLFAAFAAVLVVVPYFVFRRNVTRGFVHAAFFLQIAAMVLGDWKLYLPGSAAALYLLWCVAAFFMVRRRSRNSNPEAKSIIAGLIYWSENRQPLLEARLAGLRGMFASPVSTAVVLMAAPPSAISGK